MSRPIRTVGRITSAGLILAAVAVAAEEPAVGMPLFLEEAAVSGGIDLAAATRVDVHVRQGRGGSLGVAVGGVRLERVGTPGGKFGLWLRPTAEQAATIGLLRPEEILVVPIRDDDPPGEPSPRVRDGLALRRVEAGQFAMLADSAEAAAARLTEAASGEADDDDLEVTTTHVLDRDAGGPAWELMRSTVAAKREIASNLTLVRVLLEDPAAEPGGAAYVESHNPQVQLGVTQAMDDPNISRIPQILRNGFFFGAMSSYGPGEEDSTNPKTIHAARHYSATIDVPAKPDGLVDGGDVLLRRPAEADRCDVVVRVSMLSGRTVGALDVEYGPGTFIVGKEPLDRDGVAKVRGLAAGPFRIGLSIRRTKEERADVVLAPGTLTTLEFVVDDMGQFYFVAPPRITAGPREGDGDV